MCESGVTMRVRVGCVSVNNLVQNFIETGKNYDQVQLVIFF